VCCGSIVANEIWVAVFLPPSTLTARSICFISIFTEQLAKALLARYVFFYALNTSCLSDTSQVRVVEHKRSKKLYALKYIDKTKCIKQKAVANIIQERRLLEEACISIVRRCTTHKSLWSMQVDHPFIVNMRYAFQDDENCFFVLDLMLGGDLRCE
jgi:hypothetical protein